MDMALIDPVDYRFCARRRIEILLFPEHLQVSVRHLATACRLVKIELFLGRNADFQACSNQIRDVEVAGSNPVAPTRTPRASR